MDSRARVFGAFLFASAVVMLTVGLIAAFGTPLWQDDGVPVCGAYSSQGFPQIASDGSGGAIVTWADWRDYGTNSRDVYAQQVDADGNVGWVADGVSLCVDSSGQFSPDIVSDGSGGAIVTWGDRRSGSGNDDIYARRVYSDGTAAWAADGVSLCVATNDQYAPQIASDGSGGAIVTWEDRRSNGVNFDIYARRVASDGNVLWADDGVSLCVSTNDQRYQQIVSDGAGGAIVAWHDARDLGTTGPDIYAQRVDADGNTMWALNGVSLCVASSFQLDPQVVSDGVGGAIVTWEDQRSGITYDIYAQRVYSDGTMAWTPDGVSLTVAGSGQYDPQITSDGSGGAIVVWEDYSANPDGDIYAQRVDSGGNVLWQTYGVSICFATDQQLAPRIVSDGSGGAFVTWQDRRNGSDFDIYARRVLSDGTVAWPPDGLGLCFADGDQRYPQITWDGNSAAIVTWEDHRLGVGSRDIYAQRVGDYHTVVRLPLIARKYP